MGQETPFDKSALYDEDFVRCSCGFLQFLGFRCRITKAIHPGSYSRLHNSDSEPDTSEDTTSLSEKDHVAKTNSYRRNIKAWIKRRINRKQNKKQKLYPGTTQLSRSNALHRSKFNQTSGSIKELGRTLLDGLLHRIPYGQKVPEEMIKEKLCRSLSADYDAYTKKGKKSGVPQNANQDSNKFRRIHSSPASVTEKKLCDAIDVKRGEETLLNGYHEKDIKCDTLELVQDNETDASVCEKRNGADEDMVSTGEHAENMICESLKSKEDAIDSGVSCNLEFETKEERNEKTENGSIPSEIKDVGPMKSPILQVDIRKKDLCIDQKDLEPLTNLLKQLGFDTLLGTDEETSQTTPIKAEEDDETQILDTEVGLEEFKRAWDQINKVEFAKFDCNILPQDLILVLDLIDQAYTEAYNNCSSSVVWSSSYVSKLSPKMIKNHVLKEVQERVTWHLKAHEECSDEADDLVAWDFERYDEWLDHRADFEKIVVELERLVLDDLVEGLVVEDTEIPSLLR